MSELADNPKPSPEIEQLVLFGRIDEAVALYAKQAEVDVDTARAVIDEITPPEASPSAPFPAG